MRPLTSLARAIATRAHAGQTDKAGQPYVGHLERVVANLLRAHPDATDHEIAAAWLHDVVEDCGLGARDLIAQGVSPEAVSIVMELTRPDMPYLDWIRSLAAHGFLSAVRVKLADNEDNSDPARVAAIPNGAAMLAKRYRPTREMLLARLAPALLASSATGPLRPPSSASCPIFVTK